MPKNLMSEFASFMASGQCAAAKGRMGCCRAPRKGDTIAIPASSESIDMANREQRSNREKKKPKQDKSKKDKSPSPFVQVEVGRKPQKAKDQG